MAQTGELLQIDALDRRRAKREEPTVALKRYEAAQKGLDIKCHIAADRLEFLHAEGITIVQIKDRKRALKALADELREATQYQQIVPGFTAGRGGCQSRKNRSP